MLLLEYRSQGSPEHFIDLLMGLFRGAVFRHGGGALKQPIKEPTETPTSTLALMGRFPSLMGRFPALMGRFTDFVLRGRFTSWKSTGKQPIKKRGIKRLLNTPMGEWPFSVKVRRGRQEGDGTENVMTERPSHAHWFCPWGPWPS